MNLLINVVIIVAILAFAGYQIVRVVQQSKKGKCAACDYECEAKKMMAQAKKQAQ
ncbi:FeoB-associated Cys-rich membrane protein [uncultured Secundilactobacillus sp.]|uniref:FeoB-associated Cys-rich membrane protein n=1 Tax=uncultured Secundilactobacillus sp. TaxID=2813935 RepID=UPI0025860C60|nr:FeoB-associated Cys-rich membrane protein [uncultured Secundilactobacillus sp.]